MKPMFSDKVTRVDDIDQQYINSPSSAFQRVPSGSKFTEDCSYLSLYADAATGPRHKLWTTFDDQRGVVESPNFHFTDQVGRAIS